MTEASPHVYQGYRRNRSEENEPAFIHETLESPESSSTGVLRGPTLTELSAVRMQILTATFLVSTTEIEGDKP